MKIISAISLFALLSIHFSIKAQQSPDCDSVFINCCTIQFTHNQIFMDVANHSQTLFDYPGFILFNGNNDTIAKENVNFFGLGYSYQQHILNIANQFSLPFNGVLKLYSGFYDTLQCSFPIVITDSVMNSQDIPGAVAMKIFPNPASQTIHIEIPGFTYKNNYCIQVSNILGEEILRLKIDTGEMKIPVSLFKDKGLFIVTLYDDKETLITVKKLLITE